MNVAKAVAPDHPGVHQCHLKQQTGAVEPNLTTRQAYEAMRIFVNQFAQREPEQHRPRFEQLIRWTRVDSDGITVDPAQWEDWETAVQAALAGDSV